MVQSSVNNIISSVLKYILGMALLMESKCCRESKEVKVLMVIKEYQERWVKEDSLDLM